MAAAAAPVTRRSFAFRECLLELHHRSNTMPSSSTRGSRAVASKASHTKSIEVIEISSDEETSSAGLRTASGVVAGQEGFPNETSSRLPGSVSGSASAGGTRKRKRQNDAVLDTFIQRSPGLSKPSVIEQGFDSHESYPFPILRLPPSLSDLDPDPSHEPERLNTSTKKNAPDLDLVVYTPFLNKIKAKGYGDHIRSQLPFYRVSYTINRFGKETLINTPRYTTVFGIDDTSRFDHLGKLVDSQTGKPVKLDKYKHCRPRPIPSCLRALKEATEKATGTTFNYALVNYYATGSDSISYHSDDEKFLEREPAIASFSFCGVRDFYLRHKPVKDMKGPPPVKTSALEESIKTPIKFKLSPGTLILMQGPTQRNWLHAIPKRADGGGGRINITFRKNMTVAGTENYYRYNVGTGPVYKWDLEKREMRLVESLPTTP